MNMDTEPQPIDDSQRDPFEEIVEDFVGHFRVGDAPDVEDVADQNPELSGDVRDLLPVVAMMEQWKQERTHDAGAPATLGGVMPESLGDFRLIRRIGSGGMGMVFEAHQKSLDRKVAIKILPPAARISGNAKQRFYREARLAAALHHPNIVTVYGAGESGGLNYIVMRLVSALSISSIGEAMPPERVARLGRQAAEGLAYAHSQNILHRDIKPANMLVDEEDRLWLADFGLARALEEENETRTGELAGTLMYLPPERTRGQCDARSDVYSLGLSLYQLLSGQRPFEATGTAELLSKITNGHYVRNRIIEDAAPTDLVLVLRKACALDPDDRYHSAADFSEDLTAFLEGRPVKARRLNPLQTALKWARRNPVISSLTAAVATLLTCVLVLSVLGYAQQRQQRERVEATLDTALDALDRVYLRLAPTSLSNSENPLTPAPVSPQTAELLEELLSTYTKLTKTALNNERIRTSVAHAHRRTGDIRLMLQDPSSALRSYAQALIAADDAAIDDPQLWQQFRAETMGRVADAHAISRNRDASKQARQDAIEAFARVTDDRFDGVKQLELARTLLSGLNLTKRDTPGPPPRRFARDNRAEAVDTSTRRPPAQEDGQNRKAIANQAVQLLTPLCDQDPPNPEARMLLAVGLRELSGGQEGWSINDQNIERSIEILKSLHEEFPARPEFTLELVQSYAHVPPPHEISGSEDTAVAGDRLEKSIKHAEMLADQHVDVPQYRYVEIVSKTRYADFLMERTFTAHGAERTALLQQRYHWLNESERLLTELHEAFPGFSLYTYYLLRTRLSLADTCVHLGQVIDAETLLAMTEEPLESFTDPDFTDAVRELHQNFEHVDQRLSRSPLRQ